VSTSVPLPDVDAVIVAHDSGPLLAEAVASIEGQVPVGRVVVVDAGSIDGSVDAMLAEHPDVRVIRTENRGFAAANNVGIKATSGKFVLLLNPDAVLEELGLRSLVSRVNANRTVGIVAPRVTNEDGSTQLGSFGGFPTLRHLLNLRLNSIIVRLSGGHFGGRVDVIGTTPVDWVTGACMLVRRSAIDAVGPMDEGFFLYYEDVEWCHRMHDAGWTVLIEPDSTCVHARGGSGGGESKVAQAAYRASFYRYCKLYKLGALAFATRIGVASRKAAGGRG
jgi:GT2 family glycosyltransferase